MLINETARIRIRRQVLGSLAAAGMVCAVLAGAMPASALADVTQLSAGTGIALSPNPITASGTVALKLPLALTSAFSSPFASLTNNGSGVGVLASSAGNDGVRSITSGTGHAAVSGLDHSGGGYGGYFSSAHGTGLFATGPSYGGQFTTGPGIGVIASSSGNDGARSSTSADAHAAFSGTDSSATGGYGGYLTSSHGIGAYVSSAGNDGVRAFTVADAHAAVSGTDRSAGGGFGGYFSSSQGTGIFAGGGISQPAGVFNGDVTVQGNLHLTGSVSSDRGGAWTATGFCDGFNSPTYCTSIHGGHDIVSVSVPAGSYIIQGKATIYSQVSHQADFCELKQGAGPNAPDLDRTDIVLDPGGAIIGAVPLLATASFTEQTTITLRCSGPDASEDQGVLTAVSVGEQH